MFSLKTTTAGFEPTRISPVDFESTALTTRPNCQSNIFLNKVLLNLLTKFYK